MVTTAWGGAKDADVILVLIDAERGIKGDADAMLDRVATAGQPKILILNKIDRVKPETLLALSEAANARVEFKRTFMVSALTGPVARTCSTISPKRCRRPLVLSRGPDSRTCRCASSRPR